MSVSEEREWTISLGATDPDGDEKRIAISYRCGGTDVFVREVTPLGFEGYEAAIPAETFLEISAAIEGMARREMLDRFRDRGREEPGR
jgi:hypothetical protein